MIPIPALRSAGSWSSFDRRAAVRPDPLGPNLRSSERKTRRERTCRPWPRRLPEWGNSSLQILRSTAQDTPEEAEPKKVDD